MRVFGAAARHIFGAALLALGTACGGGGGGGAEGEIPQPAPVAQPAAAEGAPLAVALQSPDLVLRDSLWEGQDPHAQAIGVTYSGETTALIGRTLYVIVTQPHPLFGPNPEIIIDPRTQSATLYLRSSWGVQPPVGRLQGALQIFVCLDAECKTQLQNSPLAVNYDVDIKPAIQFSTDTLVIESSSGQEATGREVRVTLAPEAADWSVAYDRNTVNPGAIRDWLQRTPDSFYLQAPPLALPGTYRGGLLVKTTAPDRLNGYTVILEKRVGFTYTLKPAGS